MVNLMAWLCVKAYAGEQCRVLGRVLRRGG